MTWVYLSHVLRPDTPAYGGSRPLEMTLTKSLAAGDSCNEGELVLPLHLGTHVDAPRHFDDTGAAIEVFEADQWHVTETFMLDVPTNLGGIVDLNRLDGRQDLIPKVCELLLIRTGCENLRSSRSFDYASAGPCLGDDFARWLRQERSLSFIGIDAVSVSSPVNRETGRRTHRELLCSSEFDPVLIIEDMHLAELKQNPAEVWILPLRVEEADGAPVTVVARV